MNSKFNFFKITLVFSVCLVLTFSVKAQKFDNTWIFGYTNPAFTVAAGLDFYFGAPIPVGFNPPFNFIGMSDASISNANGDLMFYSNGSQVANWNNQIMSNSSGFNIDLQGTIYSNEMRQGVLSLPFPGHPNQFVLFHLCGMYINSMTQIAPMKLFYSVIDMNANNGEGNMILKNQIAFTDSLSTYTMHATRHANGRDWWVVNHQAFSNKIYVSLLTPAGVVQHNSYNTGPSPSLYGNVFGQSEFSPDGSLYAMTSGYFNGAYLFDFDRCSGVISFRDSIQIVPNDANEQPAWGCAFSPNSRYLYVNTNNDLYQLDTWSGSLALGMKLIAQENGPPNSFFRNQLGPDGKIYMVSRNSDLNLNVINNPDENDTLCNFVQDQQQLISYSGGNLPVYPNYRLGAVVGSICDSLTSSTHVSEFLDDNDYNIAVFPNPNEGNFVISYLLESDKQGVITVTDVLGKIVFQDQLSKFSIKKSLQLGGLRNGMYYISIQSGTHRKTTKLLIAK